MLSLKFVKALFYSGPWGIYYRATWALPSSLELRKISHMAKNAILEKLPQLFCMLLYYIHMKTIQ